MVSPPFLCHPAMMHLFLGTKSVQSFVSEGLRKVLCIHRSAGDVWIFQPLVVWMWIPASVLDKVPGVGMGAAGSGHAPDRCLQLSLPKLWRWRPSALQPESPGLRPCCRQRGIHSLPESHWTQVGRWVFISEWGPELWGTNKGAYLVKKKKKNTH